MCGRYAITVTPEMVRAYFGYEDQPNFPPRYNIAPTQPVPVMLNVEGKRRFVLMRWGFVPGFIKDLKDYPLVINIRSETAREKPSFRAAFTRRHALMPADGFYEWRRDGERSTPFLVRKPDRGIFAFAALWETWSSPDGSEIDTVALLNTSANGTLAAIHERAPVILDPKDYEAWLDPQIKPEEAQKLLRPPADDLLELVEISTAINHVANDHPGVQEPASRQPPAQPVPRKRPTARERGGQGSLF